MGNKRSKAEPEETRRGSVHSRWHMKQAEAVEAARAEEQADAAETERLKQQEEFEGAMERWRMPPDLDEQVAVLVAQHAGLGLGDFSDLSAGGGFEISDTAKRAISLSQLTTLAAHLVRRVEVNQEQWMMTKYVGGVATDHRVTSAYEVCATAKRGAG